MKHLLPLIIICLIIETSDQVGNETGAEPVRSKRSSQDESIFRRYLAALPSDRVIGEHHQPSLLLENYANVQQTQTQSPGTGNEQQQVHWSALSNYYKKVYESSLGQDLSIQPQTLLSSQHEKDLLQDLLSIKPKIVSGTSLNVPSSDQLWQLYVDPHTSRYQHHQPSSVSNERLTKVYPPADSRYSSPINLPGSFQTLIKKTDHEANNQADSYAELLAKLQQRQPSQAQTKASEAPEGAWFDQRPASAATNARLLASYYDTCGERNFIGAEAMAKAGTFPSHVGIFKGEPSDNNYLCGGVWLQDQWVLTLATCVSSFAAEKSGEIFIRLGEWSLGEMDASSKANSLLAVQVEKVHVHPGFDSREDNLALLKLTRAIDKNKLPFVSPACLLPGRATAAACWAPIRKVKTSEYFDADDEGEYKERQSFRMIEIPIKLVSSNEAECKKQTRFDHFNYHYQKYICSADFQKDEPRAALNRSDYFGAGIYCNEGGRLTLVSILHPLFKDDPSRFGYLNLAYYKPSWIDRIVQSSSDFSDLLKSGLLG